MPSVPGFAKPIAGTHADFNSKVSHSDILCMSAGLDQNLVLTPKLNLVLNPIFTKISTGLGFWLAKLY